MTLAAIAEKLKQPARRPDIVEYEPVWSGSLERAGKCRRLGNWDGSIHSHHGPSQLVHAEGGRLRGDPDLGVIR